jgi:tRNA(Ile)-lysidine synthase
VGVTAKRRKISIETAAREVRYEFFAKAARRLHCRTVATAHTLSDNAETILQRLIEGTGPEGLRGIPLVRPISKSGDVRAIRPLLFAARDEIERYLVEHNLEARIDGTNLEPFCTRNRIRLEVIPLLKKLNPSAESAVARTGVSVGSLLEYIADDVFDAVGVIVSEWDKDRVVLDCEALNILPDGIAGASVKDILLEAGVDGRALGAKHIGAVLDLAWGDNPSGVVELPGNLEARRNYDEIVIGEPRPAFECGAFEETLAVPGTVRLPGEMGQIEAKFVEGVDLAKFVAEKSAFEEIIDADRVTGALVVRFPRKGDAFRPLGAPGRRKLQDIFTDTKTPRPLRESTPVVCDSAGIVWLAGYRIAERVKVTGATRRFLRLAIGPRTES